MKTILFLALLVLTTSCSMGIKYDARGDIQGYTELSKFNVDDQAKF